MVIYMKEEVINLCNVIKINNKCNGCGGKFNNYTCIYCGNGSEILEELENKLVSILSSDITLDEDIFIWLFNW